LSNITTVLIPSVSLGNYRQGDDNAAFAFAWKAMPMAAPSRKLCATDRLRRGAHDVTMFFFFMMVMR